MFDSQNTVLPRPNASDEDGRFQRLKKELHERLIAGMDLAGLRSVDPNRLRQELRRAAEELTGRYEVRLDARLGEARGHRAADQALTGADEDLAAGPASRASGFINRLLPESGADRLAYQRRLLRAGISHPAGLSNFFAARLVLMVTPPLVGVALGMTGCLPLHSALLWGCATGLCLVAVPHLWLRRAVAKRQMRLHRSLPDFLDLMIVCLDSGLSIQGAIQRVADELGIAHPELAQEMLAVQRDIDLGGTVNSALRRFAERSGSDEVRILSTFVREAQRYGTQLSEALRMHADTLRMRREQNAEEKAQKAAVKMLAPTLLLIFPAVFVVLVGPAAIQIQRAFAQ